MHDLRNQIATLAKTFQPDPRLDEPVMAARDAAREARTALEQAKARLDQAARNYRPGDDRSALDAAEREVERSQAKVRTRLEQTVKATAEREAKYQRAALAAFDKARPVITELVEAMSELSEALRPLQEFAGQRDISGIRATAHVPAFQAGVDALRGMARH
jgi:uncharacterized protein YukE